MKIFRDVNGKVQNIGEWDYAISFDDDGNEVINNPMPEGLIESDEEVVIGFDGGTYVHDDPRQFSH